MMHFVSQSPSRCAWAQDQLWARCLWARLSPAYPGSLLLTFYLWLTLSLSLLLISAHCGSLWLDKPARLTIVPICQIRYKRKQILGQWHYLTLTHFGSLWLTLARSNSHSGSLKRLSAHKVLGSLRRSCLAPAYPALAVFISLHNILSIFSALQIFQGCFFQTSCISFLRFKPSNGLIWLCTFIIDSNHFPSPGWLNW